MAAYATLPIDEAQTGFLNLIEMREKLLSILAEHGSVVLTKIPEMMPEVKGIYCMYMPVKEGINPNILWLSNVNEEFIIVFNTLINEKIIDWSAISYLDMAFVGSPIYSLPIATKRLSKGKKECWLPITIQIIN